MQRWTKMQSSWTDAHDARISTICVLCNTDGIGICEDTKLPLFDLVVDVFWLVRHGMFHRPEICSRIAQIFIPTNSRRSFLDNQHFTSLINPSLADNLLVGTNRLIAFSCHKALNMSRCVRGSPGSKIRYLVYFGLFWVSDSHLDRL